MKYFLFLFVFIVSFCLINIRQIELFGLALFLVTNILFFVFVGKDLTDGSISPDGKSTEWFIKFGTLLISIAFSFVSSIMMFMTIVTLQNKFGEKDLALHWSPTDRKKLDETEIIFTTVTTFIGVTALYVYFQPEEVRKFTYSIFDGALNGPPGDWLRVLFPIAIIGVGSALYGQLEMPPLEVNKIPKSVICDPKNNTSIQQFKDSFIKTFWFLFAYSVVVLARPFIEANFGVLGVFPSNIFGFSSEDRTLIYGQNPSIRLVSLLTLGISNLMGVNKKLQDKLDAEPHETKTTTVTSIIKLVIMLITVGLLALGITSITNSVASYVLLLIVLLFILMFLLSFFIPKDMNPLNAKTGVGKSFSVAIADILMMPILRWDVMYLLAKYAFGLAGLVYAGFSIRDFDNIPKDDSCLYKNAHIRQLYIAFIVFLIIFYSFSTLSASMLTSLVTNITRYLVPPTLIALSSYLVFITNYFSHIAPNLVIQ